MGVCAFMPKQQPHLLQYYNFTILPASIRVCHPFRVHDRYPALQGTLKSTPSAHNARQSGGEIQSNLILSAPRTISNQVSNGNSEVFASCGTEDLGLLE